MTLQILSMSLALSKPLLGTSLKTIATSISLSTVSLFSVADPKMYTSIPSPRTSLTASTSIFRYLRHLSSS
jgi:hypothetical protein